MIACGDLDSRPVSSGSKDFPSNTLSVGGVTSIASSSVGRTSICDVGTSMVTSAGMWPGHEMAVGTRIPPSCPPITFPPEIDRMHCVTVKLKMWLSKGGKLQWSFTLVRYESKARVYNSMETWYIEGPLIDTWNIWHSHQCTRKLLHTGPRWGTTMVVFIKVNTQWSKGKMKAEILLIFTGTQRKEFPKKSSKAMSLETRWWAHEVNLKIMDSVRSTNAPAWCR